MEQCVEVVLWNGNMGKWNDINCGHELSSYICKKRLGDVIDPQPTAPWPGNYVLAYTSIRQIFLFKFV